MLRGLHFAGLLLMGLALSACLPVTSKNPVGSTKEQQWDDALSGTWRGGTPDGKSPSYFHFLPAKDGNAATVLIVNSDAKDSKEWMGVAVSGAILGENRYLNARMTYENGEPKTNSPLFQVLYTLKNNRLTIYLLDEKLAAEAVKAGRIAGTVDEGQFGSVALTADANALDAFFTTREGADLFAEKMFVLTKVR